MTIKTTMPKAYEHTLVEEDLYSWWEQHGYFRPETQADLGQARPGLEPFVIAMPPPNVTGALHLGHAITSSVEDMLMRYNRMRGRPALWIPGTDHAGIATQSVVERKLEEQGVTRSELGRERFVQEVWDWKDEYHDRISNQQRRMGISCDWSRERFTLDDGLSAAVLEAFLTLYNEGLIYRDTYLVNWSPGLQTAVSDLEVEYSEEAGKLYYFKYQLADGSGHLAVATTRPETILGDTAVAVHPEDERYQAMIGRQVVVPILGRTIPVIADEYVDREFGTGALKITPGHDPNDYEIAQRHDLPIINIMNKDATLNEAAGPYTGQERFAARKQLWADMEAAGLTLKADDYTLRVPRSQRGGEIIEPMVSTQWFMRMEPLAGPAMEAVRNGDIQIVPERFEKVYFHWLENIRDWCISRQLWWGHRIPIWYGPDDHAFAARSESDAREQAMQHYGKDVALEQDPDVLDTWFSSGLWPFSTLGWPDKTQDLAAYYPTSVMETGYDILFFWVARMIMLGLKFTGQAPFHTVYLHGLVRDETGVKMSKSLGNVLDPLDLVSQYGTDALRFTLLTGGTPGNDLKLSVTRVEASRNFANKIWNAARFVIMNLDDESLPMEEDENRFAVAYALPPGETLALSDRWILHRLAILIKEVNRLIGAWQLGEAGRQIYDFLWNEYCDWYIEAAKVRLYGEDEAAAQVTRRVLAHVLEQSLRLLHPYMPFVTEAIWQNLPEMADYSPTLMLAHWPETGGRRDPQADEEFSRIQALVRGIRNVRSEYNVEPARRIVAQIAAGDERAWVERAAPILSSLARLDESQLVFVGDEEAPRQAAALAEGGVSVFLPLAGMVDLEAERKRIAKELEGIDRQLTRIENMLKNPGFLNKAPAEVIQREQDRQAELSAQRTQLVERMETL
ncbi:MAG: valine--tRNA ligase [Caldilineaceae bacterium]|nr:valine--tRNA ligase [Caldilineaceae bacterium]